MSSESPIWKKEKWISTIPHDKEFMIQEPSLEISVINKEFDTLIKLKQQLEMNIPEPK